ncbi:unnamed protein product [Colias eurytheme]|nr:unnamed protein product [Colias eurytheme]
MEVPVIEAIYGKGRKRKREPEKWKANRAKVERYSSQSLPGKITCNHNSKSFGCKKLRVKDQLDFHRAFYATPIKKNQDARILKCCSNLTSRNLVERLFGVWKRRFPVLAMPLTKINRANAVLYAEEFPVVANEFFAIAGFPRVVGAVDCTHIKINSPGAQSEIYHNRKGYFSLNVQMVCDVECPIRAWGLWDSIDYCQDDRGESKRQWDKDVPASAYYA